MLSSALRSTLLGELRSALRSALRTRGQQLLPHQRLSKWRKKTSWEESYICKKIIKIPVILYLHTHAEEEEDEAEEEV